MRIVGAMLVVAVAVFALLRVRGGDEPPPVVLSVADDERALLTPLQAATERVHADPVDEHPVELPPGMGSVRVRLLAADRELAVPIVLERLIGEAWDQEIVQTRALSGGVVVIEPGDYRVQLDLPLPRLEDVFVGQSFEIVAGASRADIVLSWPAPWMQVDVEVTGRDSGEPLWVGATLYERGDSFAVWPWDRRERGPIRLWVPAGRTVINLQAPNGATATRELDVVAGEDQRVVMELR